MLEQLGGRKFLLTLIVIAVGTLVQLYGTKGINSELTALLLGCIATFSAANAVVTNKAMGIEAEAAPVAEAAPAQQPVDLSPIVQAISQLDQQQQQLASQQQALVETTATLQKGAEITSALVKAAVLNKTS